MIQRRCTQCGSTYEPPARFCVRDGSPLVEADGTGRREVAVAGAGPRVLERTASDDFMPADAPMPGPITLAGQLLDGRYEVRRRLGEGGMSYVYDATDRETKARVAVKVLLPRLTRDPASVERMRREAAMAMQFDHPNVCPILRVGQTPEGLLYLVMPFLEGEPLSEHETRRGPYPVDEGVALLIQICHGLQHAHDRGIVHRDLKPENIMLVPDESVPGGFRAVVMDFGLAKERRTSAEVRKLTQTGIVLGTPEFMSPEQVRGKPLDGRSDVYELAILGFELFTGDLPFEGKSAQDTMISRLRGQAKGLRNLRPELPQKLEQVLHRALALAPDDRYASMEEFAFALEHATSSGLIRRFFRR